MRLPKRLLVLVTFATIGLTLAQPTPKGTNHYGCPTGWELVAWNDLPEPYKTMGNEADNKNRKFGQGDGAVCMKNGKIIDNQMGANDPTR